MTDHERVLACIRCGIPVTVHEIPVQFIDPELFVCGECLEPTRELTLLDTERPDETRRYDKFTREAAFGTANAADFPDPSAGHTRFGNRAFNWLERNTVQRVPGYQPVKEIVSYLGKRDQNPFARPVFVRVSDDVMLTGFLADEGAEGPTIFVPTGPNPTTGLILHVSSSQVQRIMLPGSDVLKTVIACGAGSQRLLRSIAQPGVELADTAPTI